METQLLTHLKTTPQAESRGAVLQTRSQNRCNPACVVQQNTATKIHSANVPLHNTASVQVRYTIAGTQLTVSTTVLLNHRATATKDTYHVTLYKQQYAANVFTTLNLRGEIESV